MTLLALLSLLATAAPLDAWKPLLGTWVADAAEGAPRGEFTLSAELSGKVLVRKSFAEYPAAQGRPAYRHDDLMVLSPAADAVRATYWDNEGHVIAYRCTAAAAKWTCETEGAAPGFRLEYTLDAKESLQIAFFISPSGKPEAFKPYLSSKAHRK